MPTPDKESGSSGGRNLDRRDVLKGLGAAGAVGLAGCSGNGGNGGNGNGGNGNGNGGNGNGNGGGSDLGERVPEPLILEYWSNMGAETTQWEDSLPIIQENLEEALRTDVEIRPTEFATQVSHITNDQRTHHLAGWYHTNTPDRLDPQEMTRRFAIDWAGGNGNANPNNWAHCEFSRDAIGQASAADEAERQEMVTNAHRIMAEEYATLPFLQTMLNGAVNTDNVNLAGHENAGIINTNANVFMLSTPTDSRGDRFTVNGLPEEWATSNFPTNQNSGAVSIWSHLVHSPLVEYDENLDVEGVLASDWETEEDGSLIRAFLEEDMQFHDGTEITAEDVQFTFEHMWGNAGSFPHGGAPPYTSIDIVDDKTVEFVFEDSYLPLITREWPRWGIFHSQEWRDAGVDESPDAGSAPVENAASGPFALTDFTQQEFAQLDPHPEDGHPKYSVDHGIDFEVYRDTTASTEAFLAGEIDMYQQAPPGALSRIDDEADFAQTVSIPGFMGHQIYPQCNIAPGKFSEFRHAVGETFDIDLINEVGWRNSGNPDTISTSFRQTHPFREDSWEDDFPHYTESTGPNIEAARQHLQDAGWGWDDDGNLRYPADADTSELWPPESQPLENEDDWECIEGGELTF